MALSIYFFYFTVVFNGHVDLIMNRLIISSSKFCYSPTDYCGLVLTEALFSCIYNLLLESFTICLIRGSVFRLRMDSTFGTVYMDTCAASPTAPSHTEQ